MNVTVRIFILLLVGLVPPTDLAADSKSIDTAIEWLRTACVSGENLEIKAEGDGGISFLKKGVQGKLYFSKKDARGVVDSLQGESQRDDLREQRECMQPYIHRILDAILGNQGDPVSTNRQLPVPNNAGVKQFSLADDDTTFLFDGRHWFTFEHGRTANAGCIRTALDGKNHTHCVGRSIDFTEDGRTCGIIYLGTKDEGLTADFALRCQGS